MKWKWLRLNIQPFSLPLNYLVSGSGKIYSRHRVASFFLVHLIISFNINISLIPFLVFGALVFGLSAWLKSLRLFALPLLLFMHLVSSFLLRLPVCHYFIIIIIFWPWHQCQFTNGWLQFLKEKWRDGVISLLRCVFVAICSTNMKISVKGLNDEACP